MEVNGPYIIENIEYVRDFSKPGQGTLVITAGGEHFAGPMSVTQMQAKLDEIQRVLGDP